MERLIPASASECLSIDGLPTGSVHLLMRRHEMPEKIFVGRWWDGMERPEKSVYVPECTTSRTAKYKTRYGRDIPLCEHCNYAIGDRRWSYCPKCGARIDVDE